jgi:hypothetical protein
MNRTQIYICHIKRCGQQLFYFWAFIPCSGNVFAEPLSSKAYGIHMQTQGLMGGIYEVRR